VPLPEAYLLGIAAAVWLDRRGPLALPAPGYVRHLIGWPLAAAGARLIERSWTAAMQVDLAHPARLVTGGPYAVSRNPMYIGWAVLQLGAGLVRGSGWMIVAVPVAAAMVHRGVRREERTLDDAFGDEFRRYRATVPRYVSVKNLGQACRTRLSSSDVRAGRSPSSDESGRSACLAVCTDPGRAGNSRE
jgi:protein-S-isoprenylcysteine O-methyltransferase Ste14